MWSSSSSRIFCLSGVLARLNGVQEDQRRGVDEQSPSGDQQQDQPRAQDQHITPSWRQFTQEYYVKDNISHLDAVFYLIHLLMSAVHKRVLVTSREQLAFQVAMSIFAGALLMRLFFRPMYARVRPQLVFLVHAALTVLRASAVYTMAGKQAVHFRVGMLAENHTAGILVLTMLAILGGPFRLFEMLGLQQPWALHVLVSILYLAIHPWAAMDGIRLAYSNAMFYQCIAVHDAVSAVFDALLQALTGMPTGQQQTCSSCAGAVVYGFMCLFGSVAVPLFILYVKEQAAYCQWVQQTITTPALSGGPGAVDGAVGTATAAGASGSSENGLASASAGTASSNLADIAPAHSSRRGSSRNPQQRQSFAQRDDSNSGAGSSSSSGSSATTGTSSRPPLTRIELIEQQAEAVAAAAHPASQQWAHSLTAGLASSNVVVRWCMHGLVLVCLLIGCWLVSNAVALVLLPRVLSSQQLDRWCPNRPYAPYITAGQVYEGCELVLHSLSGDISVFRMLYV